MLISAAIASDIGKKEKNSKAISTVAGLIDGIGSLLTAISMLIIPKFKGDLFILFSISSALSALLLSGVAYREVRDLYRSRKKNKKNKDKGSLKAEAKLEAKPKD